MYQKSPFPYLLILVGIITLSCFTNLTLDREMEEPIIHIIKKETMSTEMGDLIQKKTPELAYKE